MRYTATCLFGLEAPLGAEIDALGYKRIETIDGRVTFEGDEDAAARCSVKLRFAERLYLNLATFDAPTFAALFDEVAKIPFEDIIGKRDAFPVKGHSIKSALTSIPDIQRIIKKAAATRLGGAYGLEVLPETGVKYQIEFFIIKDKCSVMIDLSGEPLHKRGYRPERVTAPLRETLAAAVASMSRPRENVLLRDPFCGSGTIAIEGAMIMKNISPGAARRHAAEAYPLFPEKFWRAAREEAADTVIRDTAFRAFASDIDPECVRIASQSAARAGVDDLIRFDVMNALDIQTEGARGTVVTNPPYGERLMTPREVERLYRDMGRAFSRLERWQFYILTSHDSFAKLFGRSPDKVRKLYNGMIPCYLYQFFKKKDAF
ncbi:MAG: class I SAM-dependent RNA methyltransferase [Clostridia bacterium]|nr:class I SAM-dependent RNA methyltransferase [Clostridia bacterium]